MKSRISIWWAILRHNSKSPLLLRNRAFGSCNIPESCALLGHSDAEAIATLFEIREERNYDRSPALNSLDCEKGFRRVKGYLGIAGALATIEQIQGEQTFQKGA